MSFHPKALDRTFCQCLAYIGGAEQAEQSVKNNDRKLLTSQCYTFLKKQRNLVYIQPPTFKLTFSRVRAGSGNICKHTSLQLAGCGEPRSEAEA